MLKNFYLIILACIFTFSIIGCGSSSTSTKSTNEIMTTAVMSAIDSAFSDATTGKKVTTSTSSSIDFTGTGWSATGTYSYDSVNTYPIIFDLTILWDSFTEDGVTISNGTIDIYEKMTSITDVTASYTGDFDVTYEEVTYDFSWDMNYTETSSGYSYSGTVTIDDVVYPFSEIGSY
jgi:hypothetical protein